MIFEFEIQLILTSKQVRMPGHVVTTDALQRLCITHVHTKTEDDIRLSSFESSFICSVDTRQAIGHESIRGQQKGHGGKQYISHILP